MAEQEQEQEQDVLQPIVLSKTGRPQLLDGEAELISTQELELHSCSGTGGLLRPQGGGTVTTHRIIWRPSVGDANSCSFAACALHLRHLLRASPHPGGYFKRSSKIDLHLRSGSGCYSPIIMDLPNSGERDSICARLESAMKQRLWEVATAGDVVKKRLEASGVPSSVGVAGILERQRAAQEATKDIASEAFSDLKSLMAQAKDVVAVIDRYAAALRRKRADEEKGKEGEEANGAAAELGSALLSIGIVNPVTKASAGTKTEYHAMLAEQLAEFLLSRGLLARFGGTLTLTDVYAIFNRARGTELISPHDLLTVCALLQPMGLGLLLRRFPSGVCALQSSDHSDDEVNAKLVHLAEELQGVMAMQASRALKLPLILVKEHIDMAEATGLLCRDETIEGVRFWPNKFQQYAAT